MATDHPLALSTPGATTTGELRDELLDALDQVLERLGGLARGGVSRESFYPRLLKEVACLLSLPQARIWLVDDSHTWQSAFAARGDGPGDAPPPAELTHHVAEVARCGRAAVIERAAAALAILAPVMASGECRAVLELVALAPADKGARDGYLNLATSLAETAAVCEQQALTADATAQTATWKRLNDLSVAVHTPIEVAEIAMTIAQQARRLAGCDRVTVLTARRQQMRPRAVSGVETFDPRSNVLRAARQLAEAAGAQREPLVVAETADTLAPPVALALEAFRDESHARGVVVWPLWIAPKAQAATDAPDEPARLVGALVLEWFDALKLQLPPAAGQTLAAHCATALDRGLAIEQVAWWRVGLAIQRRAAWLFRGGWQPLAAGLLLVAVLVAGLTLIPAELSIDAVGRLEPQLRRSVFAPADALVAEVCVEHGQVVAAGDVLARLRSPELELEIGRVQGQIDTVRQRLAGARAARLSSVDGQDRSLERYHQLTADEESWKAEIANLEQQAQLLAQRQAALELVSPLAGAVLTWDPHSTLESRPVRRGQPLLQVGALEGPWVLDLELRDNRVGQVLTAQSRQTKPLPVTFVVAAQPEQSQTARLTSVAGSVELDASGAAVAPAQAEVDAGALAALRGNSQVALRPGATVRARIDCGPHALGYVWFHDLFDAVRRWLWL